MRIGYYVQGDADEAFVWGLARRWCPHADLAPGRFRGSSRESFRREIFNALRDLKEDKGCDFLVILTDADVNPWRKVKSKEGPKVPAECQHLTVFGVADRNIECWLAIDRKSLADEIGCEEREIPADDPSGFLKRRLELGERDQDKDRAKTRVRDFVARAPLKVWIENSASFEDFYMDIRRLSLRSDCSIPNELGSE